MFNNQYIVVKNGRKEIRDLRSTGFLEYTIFHSCFCSISVNADNTEGVAILGFIIDPMKPELGNQEICQEIAGENTDIGHLIKILQKYSGRFVLLCKNKSGFFAIPDASSLKPLLYNTTSGLFAITSSEKLFLEYFGLTPEIGALKAGYIHSPQFWNNESAWYGADGIDDRLKKVLPNHYLDISSGEILRTPIYWPDTGTNEDAALDYCVENLRGAIEAAQKRYALIQPLTAGIDSRILLAVTRPLKDTIKYYVLNIMNDESDMDIYIPRNLTGALNLPFEVIQTEDLTQNFLDVYEKEHLFPRKLPKTRGIQYHYYQHRNQNILNINGNGSEIGRLYLGYGSQVISPRKLYYFTRFTVKIPYLETQINRWHDDVLPFCKEYGFRMLDLFFWEMKSGNWGAIYPFEQDIAIEEFSPFANKELLLAMLQIDPRRRKKPACHFHINMMRKCWPEVLQCPINPRGGKVKKFIFERMYGSSDALYWFFRIRPIYRKFLRLDK